MIGFGSHNLPPGALPEIVTYLEMRAPPPPRPAALPDGLTFRRIKPDPDAYRALFLCVGAQEWLWSSRLKITDDALRDIITSPDVDIYTLTENGAPVRIPTSMA